MPHIEKKFREVIRKSIMNVSTVGDINFAYSDLIYIPMWKQDQRYSTIAEIAEIGLGTLVTDEVRKLDISFKRKGFTLSEIASAKFNSYLEFYRIVGVNYEDTARLKNECVYKGVPFASIPYSKQITGDIKGRPPLEPTSNVKEEKDGK